MRSPILESGRSGDTTNIITYSRVPGNPGWTDELYIIPNFYGHTGITGLRTQELDAGLWTLDPGHWTLDSGLWTLYSGRWTLNPVRWTLDVER